MGATRSKPRLKTRNVFEIVEGEPFGIFENPICCKKSKKLKTLKVFEKNEKWKSHSAEKVERGTLLLCNGLYFMLEALDAFKAKNEVLLTKEHRAQKVVHTG